MGDLSLWKSNCPTHFCVGVTQSHTMNNFIKRAELRIQRSTVCRRDDDVDKAHRQKVHVIIQLNYLIIPDQ